MGWEELKQKVKSMLNDTVIKQREGEIERFCSFWDLDRNRVETRLYDRSPHVRVNAVISVPIGDLFKLNVKVTNYDVGMPVERLFGELSHKVAYALANALGGSVNIVVNKERNTLLQLIVKVGSDNLVVDEASLTGSSH